MSPPSPPPLPTPRTHKKSSIALKVREAPPGWAYDSPVRYFHWDPLTPPPGLYFFYGSLQDPDILREILQQHDRPLLRPAWIMGYRLRLWGQYPALIDASQEVVKGLVFEVPDEASAAKLAAYETDNYWPAPCRINFSEDNGEEQDQSVSGEEEGGEDRSVSGFVFKYCGNSNDLSDGEFDLDRWLQLIRRKNRISGEQSAEPGMDSTVNANVRE
nr:hypothetical protein CFP56_42246 [Quercus suber]